MQHNLLDVVFKPKRSINKFSELHKGMYKAYQLVNKKKIERLLEWEKAIESVEQEFKNLCQDDFKEEEDPEMQMIL